MKTKMNKNCHSISVKWHKIQFTSLYRYMIVKLLSANPPPSTHNVFLFAVRISLWIHEFMNKTVERRRENIFKDNCIIYEAPTGFRILHVLLNKISSR